MRSIKTAAALMAVAGALALTGPALADDDDVTFKITVTNLTGEQTFTPLLAASHENGIKIFKVGDPASPELATLAESGNTGPLEDLLNSSPLVGDVDTAPGPLGPGDSVNLVVDTKAQFRKISLAGMLVPTNDAFVGLNGVRGPNGNKSMTLYALAYDAGSEDNDELCASIPGGGSCGGEGDSAPDPSDEGFIHVHAGIHGIGDLSAAVYDWRSPVAKVTIRRVGD